MGRIKISIINMKFESLTVIEIIGRDKNNVLLYNCKCDCGEFVITNSSALRQNRIKTCKKCAISKLSKRSKTHGKTKSNEYSIWNSILTRCYNSKSKQFYDYGGRGIKISERWRKFENFLKDMGNKPKDHILLRLDVNKDYNFENCVWAHKSLKNSTKRKSIRKKPTKTKEQLKETTRKWNIKNREKINLNAKKYRKDNPEKFKNLSLKKDFGITLNDYKKLLKDQNGVCKLCEKPEVTKHQKGKIKDLAVDHCHESGIVRGLLCWVCNTGIGKLQDSPELLRKAADYIEKFKK